MFMMMMMMMMMMDNSQRAKWYRFYCKTTVNDTHGLSYLTGKDEISVA